MLGRLSGDIVVSGLAAGLVLIVVLIGFTVTQYAFRSAERRSSRAAELEQMRSLAVDGAGAARVGMERRRTRSRWPRRSRSELGLEARRALNAGRGFLQHMHPADRERFRLMLWSMQEKQGGELMLDFRLRRHDGTYRWFELKAHAAPTENTRLLRCVGLLRDVTSLKRAQERLMHDAVHDSLTGLPNRELFLDRLAGAITRAREGQADRPTVMFIDIDKFKSVNKCFGLVVGDSLLLTLGRQPGPPPGPAGHAGAPRRRPVRPPAHLRAATRASSRCWPSRCAARCARR